MGQGRPALSLIEGRADPVPRIALSLVHPRERIDIPVRDVLNIEAAAEKTFVIVGTSITKTYQVPRVLLQVAPHIGVRIHCLTSQIVDEVLAVVVCGKVISRPVVYEPLRDRFEIGVNDIDGASALVAKLREGCVMPNLRLV